MRSDAQKKADKKYNRNRDKKNLQVTISSDEYNVIKQYVDSFEGKISLSRFIVWACNYFVKKGELPPESEVNQIEDYNSDDE